MKLLKKKFLPIIMVAIMFFSILTVPSFAETQYTQNTQTTVLETIIGSQSINIAFVRPKSKTFKKTIKKMINRNRKKKYRSYNRYRMGYSTISVFFKIIIKIIIFFTIIVIIILLRRYIKYRNRRR